MTVYLVRHGKDDPGIRGGWSRQGLTPEGKIQAHMLADRLAESPHTIDRVYSSDLPRASETAQILADVLAVPVQLLSEFREANNGDLAGMDNCLAEQLYPGLYWSALDFTERYPNGESPETFHRRILRAWSAFRENIQHNTHQDAVLVTHGGVIEVILCMEHGLEYSNKRKHFSIPHAEMIPIVLDSISPPQPQIAP